jgi:Copper amine oxidase N-terminal domain
MMKKTIATSLVLAMSLSATAAFAAETTVKPSNTIPATALEQSISTEQQRLNVEELSAEVIAAIVKENNFTANGKKMEVGKAYMNGKFVMVPMQELAESLGYKVEWNKETESYNLTQGAHWFNVKVGEDNYNFARMLIKLGAAPEVKEEVIYVPLQFFTEVLRADVKISDAGAVEMSNKPAIDINNVAKWSIQVNGTDLDIADEAVYVKEDNVMIPLRKVSEALGFTLTWDGQAKATEVLRGAMWSKVTIGKDEYSFAKMGLQLGKAPEMTNSLTYVPVSFVEKVLQAEVKLDESGLISINEVQKDTKTEKAE